MNHAGLSPKSYLDYFLILFGCTNYEGNNSIASNPGIVSLSKKLKQLPLLPFSFVKTGL